MLNRNILKLNVRPSLWACEHYNIYLSGAPFTVVTDHKPLLGILNKPDPPLRIARWGLRLQPYNLTLKYQTGKDNPADYMSSHPCKSKIISSKEQEIALSLSDVQVATQNDKTLLTVIDINKSGRWHDIVKYKNSTDVNYQSLNSFRVIRDELTLHAEGNLLLRDSRLVVPDSLQDCIVEFAHEAHQGINKTESYVQKCGFLVLTQQSKQRLVENDIYLYFPEFRCTLF